MDTLGAIIDTANPLNVVMARDSTIIAVFEKKKYNLTVITTTGGTTNPFGLNQVGCDTTLSIQAFVTDSCYQFKH